MAKLLNAALSHGLINIADEEVKHPHFHVEPRFFIIVLHHLEERRTNLGDLAFLCKMQRRRILTSLRDSKRLKKSTAFHTKLCQSSVKD